MTALPPKTVLVIDDDPSIHFAFQKALSRESRQIIAIPWTNKTFSIFRSCSPQLVIVDVKSWDERETTFLREAKSAEPETPVLVMTAFANEVSANDSKARGADDYIKKPFEMKDLISKLDHFLELDENQ